MGCGAHLETLWPVGISRNRPVQSQLQPPPNPQPPQLQAQLLRVSIKIDIGSRYRVQSEFFWDLGKNQIQRSKRFENPESNPDPDFTRYRFCFWIFYKKMIKLQFSEISSCRIFFQNFCHLHSFNNTSDRKRTLNIYKKSLFFVFL